ncbi:hypothetical protein M408DRAFT_307672 [Serendipita vermifera MAFF 305830]|uniref:Uncharacterized protein n=1 Tax=Serendipita vermifera MAFF 305830 TaxID=933852 RepID=A0A0C3A782_SERVB|nr:hypothetical protein M408DRAFT_307672 [Serendipita vermifera MAFF 305830]
MGGIIAALPLFLHFSVVLFLVGAIQWTLLLNTIVGSVVMATAAIALLFYLASTFLGVMSTSSPFQTPLSRGIVTLFHVSQHAGNRPLWRLFSSPSLPDVESQNKNRKSMGEPTQSSVEQSLAALKWAVSRVDITATSHRRLFHLLQQAKVLGVFDQEQVADDWIKIVNEVAWTHVGRSENRVVTEEDEEEFSLLWSLSKYDHIWQILSTIDSREGSYEVGNDPSQEQNSTQADRPKQQGIKGNISAHSHPPVLAHKMSQAAGLHAHSAPPNAAFLLLGTPQRFPDDDNVPMHIKIRLSRWTCTGFLRRHWKVLCAHFEDANANVHTELLAEFLCKGMSGAQPARDVHKTIGELCDIRRTIGMPFQTLVALFQLLVCGGSRITYHADTLSLEDRTLCRLFPFNLKSYLDFVKGASPTRHYKLLGLITQAVLVGVHYERWDSQKFWPLIEEITTIVFESPMRGWASHDHSWNREAERRTDKTKPEDCAYAKIHFLVRLLSEQLLSPPAKGKMRSYPMEVQIISTKPTGFPVIETIINWRMIYYWKD